MIHVSTRLLHPNAFQDQLFVPWHFGYSTTICCLRLYLHNIYIYDIYYVQLRVCLYSDTLTHIETQTFSHQLLNTVIRSSQNQWFRCGCPDIRVFGGPAIPSWGHPQLVEGNILFGRPWKTSLFDAWKKHGFLGFLMFPWNISFSSLSCMSIGRHLESPSARWLTRIWNPRTSCWRPTRHRDGAISHERTPGRTAVEPGGRESETWWVVKMKWPYPLVMWI